MARTALILETNPVITERYLDYTHDSDWRIMLKDTLNGFLEKLQQEKFSLIAVEESLVPQGIIQMMKSTGIPLILSTNTKKADVQTLPRNFNRTELLTVFDRLVPQIKEETEEENGEKNKSSGGHDEVHAILSDLEDEEEDFFELSSNDVVLEPSNTQHEEEIVEKDDGRISDSSFETFERNGFDSEEFMSDEQNVEPDTVNLESTEKNEKKSSKSNLFAPPPLSVFDERNSEIDDLVNSLSVDFKPKDGNNAINLSLKEEKTEKKSEEKVENRTEEETEENQSIGHNGKDFDDFLFGNSSAQEFNMDNDEENHEETVGIKPVSKHNDEKTAEINNDSETETEKTADTSDGAIKAAVNEWLNRNARSIIKEIVLEELASLSGKNND
ncbi:hypothetical protein J6Z19_09785 [bacterium]|nr:hypothetical protein [bacterium]